MWSILVTLDVFQPESADRSVRPLTTREHGVHIGDLDVSQPESADRSVRLSQLGEHGAHIGDI